MSNFFKSKYKVIALLMAFMLGISSVGVLYAGGIIGKKGGDDLVVEVEEELPDVAEETPEPEVAPVEFRSPGTMRGTFLTPGQEFLKTTEDSIETIKGQVDEAFSTAKSYTLNTIIINPNYGDEVIYRTANAPKLQTEFDIMEYIVTKAKEEDLYVYSLFDVSDYKNGSGALNMAIGSGEINALASNLSEFAEKYELDGILLDGYQNESAEDSYSLYARLGGAMGFNNYMRQNPEAVLTTAEKTIRSAAPNTQVGILADAVWANKEDNEAGSNTKATYTALGSANADTKAYIESGMMDFVIVKAFGSTTDKAEPFGEVVSWWADLARDQDIPLYVMQASSRAGSEGGWSGADQLVQQAVELDGTSGIRGNAFDSLTKLVADPGNATTTLMKYYKNEVEPELILAQLEMTKPAETTYTTNEKQVVFTGASDPTEPITINDVKIPTDQSGYFTVTYDLKGGTNNFIIVHKDKTITYTITRQVNVLTEMAPTGSITTDGSMEIKISAIAYEGATVTANVGGTSVPLTVDDNVVDEADRDSSYKRYTGVYTAPSATDSTQNVGTISVTASWEGESKTLQGASITVNKKAKIEDGVPVVVVVDQAKTYPPNTLDNIPNANYYPLPEGAMDYAVGDEIAYKGVSYTTLASGLRVLSSDIQPSSDYASGASVNGLSVDVKDGFTYVTLKTTQQVSYNFKYKESGVTIQLNNTTKVPGNMALNQNPLFGDANWSGSDLTLSFIKTNGFMGYKGYYDDSGNLVFRFNNTPSSMSGARIAIDPGHGGKDTGALGFLTDYPEKVINTAIASQLADELQSRGATVLLLETSGGMDMSTRIAKAESFNADLFISVHNNTAPNAAATGSEVYYFYPFSKALAAGTSSGASSQLGTNNRGAKQSYYTVTLSSQFPSVLVECGFMSNREEYEKLIRTKYHERLAIGIADGISSAIGGAYTGVSGGGSEGSGSGTVEVEGTPAPVVEQPTPEAVTQGVKITMNRSTMNIRQGKTGTLKATITPSTANQTATWSSSDKTIATVDNGGTVTAVKLGTATMTATTKTGEKTTCVVTVISDGFVSTADVPVEEVVITRESASVDVDKTIQLAVAIYPKDSSNTAVVWSSSDESVATVDAKGLVTAKKGGTATITATSVEGALSGSCVITVGGDGSTGSADKVDLTNVSYIEFFDGTSTMYIKATQTLKVRTDGGKTIPNAQLKWESSDRSVASVDASGIVTTKSKEGIASIQAYTKDGDLFDYMKITVSRDKVNATALVLNYDQITVDVGGTSKDIKATVTPANATDAALTWSTANSGIATVNSNGVVTGKAEGTTTLIVKTKGGSLTATARITVGKGVEIEELTLLDGDSFELAEGDTDYLSVEIYPNVSGVTYEWSSSNPNVVTVDAKGNITAVKKGKAVISVKIAGNSDLKESCSITVY